MTATGEARLSQLIVNGGSRGRADAGQVLLREGSPADSVLVLLTGRVKVSASNLNGGRRATVAVRGPGTLLGEISTLGGVPRTATVTALEAVTFAIQAASRFRAAVYADASLIADLTLHLRQRLGEEQRRRIDHVAHDASARLAARLLEIAGNGDEVPLTQYDLADLIGASLKATANALRGLREAGWIGTRRGRVTVLDAGALRRRAST